jgi:hypothetical protein
MKQLRALLGMTVVFVALLGSTVHAQDQDGTFSAEIGANGNIISGSNWISKASYNDSEDHYVVEFKRPFAKAPECTSSVNQATAPRAESSTAPGNTTKDSTEVVTLYADSYDGQVVYQMQFKLVCRVQP